MRFIDPANVKPMKVVVDGGNGMAGPMVGPLLDQLPLDLVETYWEPDGEFPDHEPNPLLRGEPPVHRRQGPRGGRRPRDRLGRRRRPLLLHRRHRPLRRRRLPHRDPRRAPARQAGPAPGRSSTTCARRAPSRDTVDGGRRHAPSPTASATRSSRPACATRARSSAARSRATTTSTTSTTPTPGTIPALLVLEKLSVEGKTMSELLEPLPLEVLHLGRDQLRGRRPATRRWRRSRSATPTAHDHPPRRRQRRLSTTGTSTCARRTPSRCCGCPRVARVRGGHGAPPRRGARADPRLVIHRLPVPTPFAVGRVNVLARRGRPADARRRRPELGDVAHRARGRPARARTACRGPRADRGHPPAHGPHRPRRPPGHAGRGRGRRPGPPGALAGALRDEHGGGRRLRGGGHAAPRHPARARARPAGGHPGVPRLGPPRRRHAHGHRRRDAGLRGADLARAPPPRPLALGHHLPRRGLRRGARRRPPPGPHLLEPARLAPARGGRPRGPAARADGLPRLAARDPGDGGRRGRPPGPRRRRHRPRGPHRRAPGHARAPRGEARPASSPSSRARPTRWPRRCGATWPSPRPTSP